MTKKKTHRISSQPPVPNILIDFLIMPHYNILLLKPKTPMGKNSYLVTDFDQEYNPRRKSKPSKVIKIKTKPLTVKFTNSSKWTLEENQKFLQFIKNNKKSLLCPKLRKQGKIFLQFSCYIKTRSPDQCRSHHQKMIKHHKDLEGIITDLEERLLKYQTSNKIDEQKAEEPIFEASENQINQRASQFFKSNIDIPINEIEELENNIWTVFDDDAWIQKPIFLASESQDSIN